MHLAFEFASAASAISNLKIEIVCAFDFAFVGATACFARPFNDCENVAHLPPCNAIRLPMYHMWYTTRIHKNQMKPKRIYKPATNRSGTSFHSFLEKQGIRAEVEAVAIKRVLAWQFQQAMRRQQKTKQAMATQLRTSRSQLDRLLDPENVSVSLATIARAAQVLGKRLIIRVTTPKSKR